MTPLSHRPRQMVLVLGTFLATILLDPVSTRAFERTGDLPVWSYRIVHRHPHDRQAFTQGLVFQGGFLYEGTGLRRRSTLRRVEPTTGRILQIAHLPDHLFGEGIALVGERIYQLTWEAGLCRVYDRATFRYLGAYSYRGEGWGLAWDGQRLIRSDGSSRLWFHDPDDFKVIGAVVVKAGRRPIDRLNELEVVGQEVWANRWKSDTVVRIDAGTGKVLGWIDLSGLYPHRLRRDRENEVLNGLAWDADAEHLWVTGKKWPEVFELEILDPQTGEQIPRDISQK